MTSICVTKVPCPESCGQGRVQVFYNENDKEYTGYCFKCERYFHEVEGFSKDNPPDIKKKDPVDLEEIASYPTRAVRSRRLGYEDLKYFGAVTSLSEEDGKTPTAIYYPAYKEGELTGYHVKTLGSKSITFAVGDVKGVDPFGMDIARTRASYRLIVTEGREDAVAVHSIYRRFGNPDYMPNIISLQNGVSSVGSLSGYIDVLNRHKEVVFCFDNDEPGQKAVKKALTIYPKGKSVILPRKDANDCIMQGVDKEAFDVFQFNATTPKNTNLIRGSELHSLAKKPVEPGVLSWPFPTQNRLLRRMRTGETAYLGAGVKMGKSELLDEFACNNIVSDDVPVLLCKPEQNKETTYRRMCNKAVGSVFHDPDVPFDEEKFDEAGKILGDKLYLLDMYQHLSWDNLKVDITHAAQQGVKAVYIDPITNLTNGVNSADANTLLQSIGQDAAAMAEDLGIFIMFFCHLKANDGIVSRDARIKAYDKGQYVDLGNCSHELGGTIESRQFTGSRAMMRSCHLMLGLAGNKDPELDVNIRNMRFLQILEDREFGNSATIPLYWNSKTTKYTEM